MIFFNAKNIFIFLLIPYEIDWTVCSYERHNQNSSVMEKIMLEMTRANFSLQDSYNNSEYGIYKNKLQKMKIQIIQYYGTVMFGNSLAVILKQLFWIVTYLHTQTHTHNTPQLQMVNAC